MNKEKLIEYISNPASLNLTSLEEIQKLVRLFPYSQNVQLLYLFNLSINQDIRFGEQLQKTATYAADRRWLKKQIEELKISTSPDSRMSESQIEPISDIEPNILETDSLLPTEKHDAKEEAQVPILPSFPIEKFKYDKSPEAIPLEDLINERNKVRSKAMLLQLVKKRLTEIETDKIVTPPVISKEETKEIENQEVPIQNKLNLIDEFIRVAPSISRPETTAFFNPDVAAQDSLFEDGSYVTETLAKIYSGQGNNRKAIEIYQILSLNNPEKSTYFAALIQELENKLN